jgi:hypothetical protein
MFVKMVKVRKLVLSLKSMISHELGHKVAERTEEFGELLLSLWLLPDHFLRTRYCLARRERTKPVSNQSFQITKAGDYSD